MLELFLLPVSFFIVLAFYKYLEQRNSKYSASSNQSCDASVNIIKLTSTNNNYDSMNDILYELNSNAVQTILGKPLYADMKGYM